MKFRISFTKYFTSLILCVAATAILSGCETVDDDRIRKMRVYINLSDAGLWNTYGTPGFGMYNYFVLQTGTPLEPAGFHYLTNSATGFGGVLLIGGMNPFEGNTAAPMAYDLSCPVEKSPTVRVRIDNETLEAVCPKCGSHYDVTMGAGAPISGPAADGKHKYGLRRYYCHPTTLNGYIINDYQ